jgi:hypothetical protein
VTPLEASTAINQPHPDELATRAPAPAWASTTTQEEEDFFADASEAAPEPLTGDVAPSEPDPSDLGVVDLTELQAQDDGEAYKGLGVTTEDWAGDPTSAEKQRGAIDREYIVFQQVALTAGTLRGMLAELETQAREPRVACLELHRTVARNDRDAAKAAYDVHKQQLGLHGELRVVSKRSFKERHFEPRVPVHQPKVRIT